MSNIAPEVANLAKNQMNAHSSRRVVDIDTGIEEEIDRTFWYDNRVGMLFSAAVILGLVVTWNIVMQYFIGLEVGWDTLDNVEKFWLGSSLAVPALAYGGMFLIEYGMRTREIAIKKGQQLSFKIGGTPFVFGIIFTTLGIIAIIAMIVLVSIPIEPFETWRDDEEGLVILIINIVLPTIALVGGILLAKAIRGKDTVEEGLR